MFVTTTSHKVSLENKDYTLYIMYINRYVCMYKCVCVRLVQFSLFPLKPVLWMKILVCATTTTTTHGERENTFLREFCSRSTGNITWAELSSYNALLASLFHTAAVFASLFYSVNSKRRKKKIHSQKHNPIHTCAHIKMNVCFISYITSFFGESFGCVALLLSLRGRGRWRERKKDFLRLLWGGKRSNKDSRRKKGWLGWLTYVPYMILYVSLFV